MKWTALNALGGLVWIAGLSLAKGTALPDGTLFGAEDHRVLIGAGVGLSGLLLLLWTNLRNAA